MADNGMKKRERVYVDKIAKQIKEIENCVWSDHVTIDDVAAIETMEHLSFEKARQLSYKPVKDGWRWGKPWSSAWFRLRIRVPASFKNEKVSLLFESGTGESLIFRDGEPVQGLSWSRRDYVLFDRAVGNERVELFLEAAATETFGGFKRQIMRAPKLAVFNEDIWKAYWDVKTLFDMVDPADRSVGWPTNISVRTLPFDDTRRARIIFGLNKATDNFDYRTADRSVRCASARKVSKTVNPLHSCRANVSEQTIACMGHAHIDVAWLWPLSETMRKCGRTFSNALELMKRYPEYIFCQSQPHLYEFTRDKYPGLYKRIKQKVKQGKWVPAGCTWVEMDCNVVSGESLVRQVLFGTRFFEQEFNHKPVCLWIPDVFGYSASIPQILKRSGIKYFLTQKISWNQFTDFPYHSFYWEGIDGSRTLSHFVPARTYNSELAAFEMMFGAREYREKDRSNIQAILYGHGDGGGGPTAAHMERMLRYRDLEGMPRLNPMSPEKFFERLEKESVDLPEWIGELYLECHRGTYTTRARNKRSNRKAEYLLRDAEMLSVLNIGLDAEQEQKKLNEAWKLILLNQFHDIIPGSSIDEVYKDSERDYQKVFKIVEAIRDKGMARLAGTVDVSGSGKQVVAFNTLPWKRQDVIEVAVKGLRKDKSYVAVDGTGTETPVQPGFDGKARFKAELPSVGYSVFNIRPSVVKKPVIKADKRVMENGHVRVLFDKKGRITRIYDLLEKRDVTEPGTIANRLLLFEDKTVSCGEAWDIEIFYNDRLMESDGKLVSMEVIERGPVRSVMRIKRAVSKSLITQDVILTAGSARIDFSTSVDWGDEKDVMLKVAFPVNIHSETARYEIQFGNVQRPTHWNTPHDFARFEVPGQKWADLSEGAYGVAMLNDCKYGYDIKGNVMRLTLLRASRSPGKNVDTGQKHLFTYSLLPHVGDYRNGVVRSGYELNVPVLAVEPKRSKHKTGRSGSFFSVTGNNVIIETIKKAEDDDGIIVRMYEAHGARGRCTLNTALPVKKAFETDLMEKPEKQLKLRAGKMALEFKPFQIRTIKFTT